MKLRHSVAALLITASLFGCTTTSEHGVTIPLAATRHNAGQIANTTVTSWDKQTTGFSFFISGIPTGTSLPLRVYTFINKGSCQQPGPVAYAMNDQVITERVATSGWTFTRSAPVAMPILLSGGYSIVVRSAPEDGNVDLFCGDIKAQEPMK
jgi:hypothetical protein